MSLHHNSDPSCPLCEDKLTRAHSDLVRWFQSVKFMHPDVHISWSYRGEQDQEQAFLDGKSKLHYPNSAHNKTDENGNPCSRALDLFQINEDNQAIFNPGFYARLSSEEHGVSVLWGGRWKTMGDYDHWQMITEEG